MSVWVYAVVSSDKQAETVDDQLAWANATAAQHGWTVTRTFRGVSTGVSGTRKLLEDLLSELRAIPKKERPERILMTRLDRTGRGLGLEPMAAFAQIHQMGVVIHTREDGDNTIKRASDVLKPFLRILTGALENETRSEKWKATHARRRAQGLHVGSIPFGCVLIEGKAVPYEPEATVVRQIFEHAAMGWGYTRLARWAQSVAPSKRLHDGTDRPLHWAASSIKSILDSKTLRGLVVDEERWQAARAQRAMDFKARSSKRWPWPLLGAVRCACGKMLTGHCAGSEPYRIRYYICRRHGLEPGQKIPSHRADKLEAAFVALLHRLTADDSFIIAPQKTDADLKARERDVRSRLTSLDLRRSKVWALLENDTLTGPQVRERLDEIDADRTAAQKELERLRMVIAEAERAHEAIASMKDVLATLSELWPQGTVEHQQEVAKAVAACVAGLWTVPGQRAVLLTGHDLAVANERQTDALRTIATSAIRSLYAFAGKKKGPAC